MPVLRAILHHLLHVRVLGLLGGRKHGIDLRIAILLDRVHLRVAILLRKRAIATQGGNLLLTVLQNRADLGRLVGTKSQALGQSSSLFLRIGGAMLRTSRLRAIRTRWRTILRERDRCERNRAERQGEQGKTGGELVHAISPESVSDARRKPAS